MLASMPIPCVDLICVNSNDEILYGWRVIPPYKNRWALPGGRILRGESPEQAAARQLKECGIKAKRLYQNGVFSVNFPSGRCDIVTSFIAEGASNPSSFGKDFSRFMWSLDIPKKTGDNYRRMVESFRKRKAVFKRSELML